MVGEKANSTVDFKTISFEKFIVWEIAARKLDFSLLLANNKGTDQTVTMLSDEIVTDKPTSGKISIPQVVFVAEQTELSLTWPLTQYLCQYACVSNLHAE